MSNGQTPQVIPGTPGSGTGFVQIAFSVGGTVIFLIVSWLFSNIFSELQHQRQRQETLFREVTALQRDLVALTETYKTSQSENVRIRGNILDSIFEMERKVQDVVTRTELYHQQREKEVHIRSMPTPDAQFSPR